MQLNITATNTEVNETLNNAVERQLRFALTRFSPSVTDVSVTLSDESGPKGAPARKCQILVRLRPKGSIVVEATDGTFDTAVARAADRAGRSVARHLEKKRHARKYQRRRSVSQQKAESPAA